jgi:uncharacterized protein (TIGR02271 family)
MATTAANNINWDDVIKKEARGSGDEDLGEVQEAGQDYVLVQRGMLNKEKFYLPKDLVESYDGHTLHFRISEEDAKSRFMGDYPPSSSTGDEGLAAARKAEKTKGDSKETTVPITEERLDVSKTESAREATITKKPVTETKTVEVPVTHEEISVERRPASGTATGDKPVESEEEVRVPLKSEEVQVTKKPYVKEEVSVKKKPVTETKTVTDKVTSEKVKVKGASGEAEEIE